MLSHPQSIKEAWLGFGAGAVCPLLVWITFTVPHTHPWMHLGWATGEPDRGGQRVALLGMEAEVSPASVRKGVGAKVKAGLVELEHAKCACIMVCLGVQEAVGSKMKRQVL